MKYLLALSVPIGLCFLVFGFMEVVTQHERMTGYSSVTAVVEETRVDSAGRDLFRPVVVYRYEVDGRTYTGKDVFPVYESGGERWAREVIRGFDVGEETEAWYDPAQPQEAYLIRRYSFFPYGMVLMGLAAVSLGLMSTVHVHRSDKGPRTPRALPDGWYQLDPPDTLVGAARKWIPFGLLWQAVGACVWGHFFAVADRTSGAGPMMATGVWIAIGLVILGIGVVGYWLSRWIGDACVLINRPTLAIGETVHVRVEQAVHKAVKVKEMLVRLECTRIVRRWINLSPTDVANKVWSLERRELVDHDAQSGSLLTVDTEFQVPADVPPSTPPRARVKERITWKLHQKLRLHGLPPCPDAFEVSVEEGAVDPKDTRDVEVVDQQEPSGIV